MLLLELDYSGTFGSQCNQHMYYLDTVMRTDEFDFVNDPSQHEILYMGCFTALDDDIFPPKDYYMESDNICMVFDSVCVVDVTTHKVNYFRKN